MTERRFECTLCGACCRRPGIVVLDDDELVAIAEHQNLTIESLIESCQLEPHSGEWWMRLQGRVCPFLRNDRCSIQAVKPRQCATYPFWPEILESDESWLAEREHCPGIDEGPVWDEAAIATMRELLGE